MNAPTESRKFTGKQYEPEPQPTPDLRAQLFAASTRIAAGLASNPQLMAIYCERSPDWAGDLVADAMSIARELLTRCATTQRASR